MKTQFILIIMLLSFSHVGTSNEKDVNIKYQRAIYFNVTSNWVQPAGPKKHCEVEIMLNTDGTVSNFDLSKCSESPEWQKSALMAISKSIPFKLPNNAKGYEAFKKIQIFFTN